jgi:hypothetical protein
MIKKAVPKAGQYLFVLCCCSKKEDSNHVKAALFPFLGSDHVFVPLFHVLQLI